VFSQIHHQLVGADSEQENDGPADQVPKMVRLECPLRPCWRV
jgi:hypothetical protein